VPKQYPHYPIYLDVEGRTVLIVGGGSVAERKVETLLRCGAVVNVVSPEFTAALERWNDEERVRLHRKPYDAGDLGGAFLVIASTGQRPVNEAVASDCRKRGIPVNVVDDPSLCDFIVPAVLERGSIQVAVSTGGKSPALARRIRKRLETMLGGEYAEVNEILGFLREPAQNALATDADRKRFFDALLDAGILEMLAEGNREEAHQIVTETCARWGIPLPVEAERMLQLDR
jgi:precorrin-2 dehydrogenase / sirohydrochlorin ferrochelatase